MAIKQFILETPLLPAVNDDIIICEALANKEKSRLLLTPHSHYLQLVKLAKNNSLLLPLGERKQRELLLTSEILKEPKYRTSLLEAYSNIDQENHGYFIFLYFFLYALYNEAKGSKLIDYKIRKILETWQDLLDSANEIPQDFIDEIKNVSFKNVDDKQFSTEKIKTFFIILENGKYDQQIISLLQYFFNLHNNTVVKHSNLCWLAKPHLIILDSSIMNEYDHLLLDFCLKKDVPVDVYIDYALRSKILADLGLSESDTYISSPTLFKTTEGRYMASDVKEMLLSLAQKNQYFFLNWLFQKDFTAVNQITPQSLFAYQEKQNLNQVFTEYFGFKNKQLGVFKLDKEKKLKFTSITLSTSHQSQDLEDHLKAFMQKAIKISKEQDTLSKEINNLSKNNVGKFDKSNNQNKSIDEIFQETLAKNKKLRDKK